MDIVLLCWRDTNHPEGGGSERYLERVAGYLALRGHNVTLRTARYPGSTKTETVEVHVGTYGGGAGAASSSTGVGALRESASFTIKRGGGNLTVYPRALLWLMRRKRADVIVDTQNGVPFFAHALHRAPTVILTHHCHKEQWSVAGPILSKLGWMIESRISPKLHRHNQWVTVSQPSADEFAALGVPPEHLSIIRNGVDLPPADEGNVAAEATNKIHVVTLSRLVPHKQIEHAIHAVSVLRHTHPNLHLDVVGDGWWMANLQRTARELHVDHMVEFHGHVTEGLKHRLLRRAWVHVMPSRKEGWGLAVIEAAQHGVPTLGYGASAGLRDSVQHNRTGVLVDSEGDFINALERLVEDPELRNRLGDAARTRAQEFSWRATGEQWEALLRRVAGR